ncbi:MAG: DUF883 domain-containing protein [Limnobacter sp.]|nr:DUF883 domain-containing protein [Limnobacter sp.]
MQFGTQNKDRLVADIRQVVADLDAVLREAVSETGAEVGGLKGRLRDGLHAARASLAELESDVGERAREAARMTSDRAREAARATSERAREAARYTDDYVHEHPWAVVGVAAGIGALIALILSRR